MASKIGLVLMIKRVVFAFIDIMANLAQFHACNAIIVVPSQLHAHTAATKPQQ